MPSARYISIGSSYYAGIKFPIDHQIEDWRMTMQTFLFVVILLVLFILLLKAIKITQINERLVIFRRGKLQSVAGPGFILIIPFLDKAKKVNLDQHINGWKDLSMEELKEKIKEIVK